MCDAGMPLATDVQEWKSVAQTYGMTPLNLGFMPCPCGRDIAYHRYRNHKLSRAALAASGEEQTR